MYFIHREQDLGSKCIIEMNGQKTTITNTKVGQHESGDKNNSVILPY